ncbi:MAG: hypothetical protein ACOY7P_10950 [Pseudomonadota bacterium]
MHPSRTIAALLAALSIALPATAAESDPHHHDHHEDAVQSGLAAPALLAGMDATAPSLIAEYELRTRDGSAPWSAAIKVRFVRSDNRLVIEQSDFAESWQRVDNGFEFERVFHADRRTVEYAPGELRTLHIEPDWAVLRAGLDRGTLAGLKAAAHRKGPHGETVRYARKNGSTSVTLDWLPRHQLPERLERVAGKRRSELKLAGIRPFDAAALAALDARRDSYLRIDASDFGDMEGDPFVQKVSGLDVLRGWRAAHTH